MYNINYIAIIFHNGKLPVMWNKKHIYYIKVAQYTIFQAVRVY